MPSASHSDGASEPGVAKPGLEDRKNSLASNAATDIDLQNGTARVLDPAAERALCRKFDYRLLPVLAFLCKPSSNPRRESLPATPPASFQQAPRSG